MADAQELRTRASACDLLFRPTSRERRHKLPPPGGSTNWLTPAAVRVSDEAERRTLGLNFDSQTRRG